MWLIGFYKKKGFFLSNDTAWPWILLITFASFRCNQENDEKSWTQSWIIYFTTCWNCSVFPWNFRFQREKSEVKSWKINVPHNLEYLLHVSFIYEIYLKFYFNNYIWVKFSAISSWLAIVIRPLFIILFPSTFVTHKSLIIWISWLLSISF